MKILVAGDTHGSLTYVEYAIKAASKLGCEKIVQVGDFGFHPHTEKGKRFLNEVIRLLIDNDLELDWIDGNHENHDWLAIQDHVDGVWTLGDVLHHHARGHRWQWGGAKFLACGGAFSIDQDPIFAPRRKGDSVWMCGPMIWPGRTEGVSWWPGETITDEDVKACGTKMVDVVFSHDAPWGCPNVVGADNPYKDDFPESVANRQKLARIVRRVRPEVVIHGHYHHRHTDSYEWAPGRSVRVEGLHRNLFKDELKAGVRDRIFAVLDTETLEVTDVEQEVYR